MLKVSIIIPVYNTEKYLKRCLDSVCNQTLSDIEIICIDDCSTDNSISILKEYAKNDSRIKLISFENNKGVSAARNAGLDIAPGKYVGFVDSDDFIDLDFYEELYKKAITENADITIGKLKELKLNGSFVEYDYKLVEQRNCKYYYTLSFSVAIYSLANIRKYNICFPMNITWGEDILFLQNNIIKANKVILSKNVYYYYAKRENSADSQVLDLGKIKDGFFIYKQILNNIDNLNDKMLDEHFYKFYYSMICNVFTNAYYKTNTSESKLFCINSLIYFYKNAKHKEVINNIFKVTYSEILSYIKDGDISKVYDLYNRHNTYEKWLFHSIRKNINKDKVSA